MSAVLPREAAPDSAAEHDEKDKPSAAQRLAESRERLRLWMVRGDGRQEARERIAAAHAEGDHPALLDRLRAMPVIGVVVDALWAWWEHHPMQPAASLAKDVVDDTIAPVARRHPLLVVAAAFVIGVAVVRFKPWRWFARPALAGGLLSQVLSFAIARIPFESWLGAFASFAHGRAHPAPEAGAAPAGPVSPYPEVTPVRERPQNVDLPT
jgi:hypothetical protein